MKILGICGSLRKGSFNMSILKAAIELAPKEFEFTIADISQIPLYNQDVEDAGVPKSVEQFKNAIAASDGLLIVTPEYNYSVPGVLKNAIDWASRPPSTTPLSGKPLAIMSASGGMLGGARAQYHLRQVAVFTNMLVLNTPEVIIAKVNDKLDADGKLVDEMTRKVMTKQLAAFKVWIERLE